MWCGMLSFGRMSQLGCGPERDRQSADSRAPIAGPPRGSAVRALLLCCTHAHIHVRPHVPGHPNSPSAAHSPSQVLLQEAELPQGLPTGLLRGAPARELDSDALGSEPHSPGERARPLPGVLAAVRLPGCKFAGEGRVRTEGDRLPCRDKGPGMALEDVVEALEAVGHRQGLFRLHASGLLAAVRPCPRGSSLPGRARLALLGGDASPLLGGLAPLGPVLRLPHGEEGDPIDVGQDLGFALLHVDRGLGDCLIEVLPRAVGHADVAREAVDLGRRLCGVPVPQRVVSVSRGHGSKRPPSCRPALFGRGCGREPFVPCQLLRHLLGDDERSGDRTGQFGVLCWSRRGLSPGVCRGCCGDRAGRRQGQDLGTWGVWRGRLLSILFPEDRSVFLSNSTSP